MGQRGPLKAQALGTGQRGRAGRAEQRVSGNWQPDLINMPGLFWVAHREGGVGGRDSIIGTPNFPSTPSSAPGLLS